MQAESCSAPGRIRPHSLTGQIPVPPDHFRCVYFHTVFVRIASGLDMARYRNAEALAEIFFGKLSRFSNTTQLMKSADGSPSLLYLRSTASVYLATAVEFSPCEYLTSGSRVNLPTKTLYSSCILLFWNNILQS